MCRVGAVGVAVESSAEGAVFVSSLAALLLLHNLLDDADGAHLAASKDVAVPPTASPASSERVSALVAVAVAAVVVAAGRHCRAGGEAAREVITLAVAVNSPSAVSASHRRLGATIRVVASALGRQRVHRQALRGLSEEVGILVNKPHRLLGVHFSGHPIHLYWAPDSPSSTTAAAAHKHHRVRVLPAAVTVATIVAANAATTDNTRATASAAPSSAEQRTAELVHICPINRVRLTHRIAAERNASHSHARLCNLCNVGPMREAVEANVQRDKTAHQRKLPHRDEPIVGNVEVRHGPQARRELCRVPQSIVLKIYVRQMFAKAQRRGQRGDAVVG